ncbi:MAG: thymidine phosphorylase [Clostridiales bacterium]|nr:thymidine phosphorylase [Clostridiales bacterium]
MTIIDIIEKKKNKLELTTEEINFFVNGFTDGSIPDYQISPLLMAIVLNGMTDNETFAMTNAMLHSGDIVDMSALGGTVVDKHSTGGIGDSTTLALAPILACCGVYVAKMSGRGLGFTGGTIDKLESIPHFDTALSEEEFQSVVKRVGCAVIGQTANLAPADKKFYALRDVTGTVNSIPLICASIMSKKLASGSDTILLDVKYGSGAFMPDPESALELAKKMVAIGTLAGKRIGALITDMQQPLSDHVGNSLEIIGIVDVLNGKKNRLYYEIKEVALRLLALTGKYTLKTAEVAFQDAIDSGKALNKFAEMVEAQHGDASYILHPEKFAIGTKDVVLAESDGYVTHMVAADIGRAVTHLGGGRMQKSDVIDFSVGVIMKVQLGSKVKKGDVLCEVYHNGKGLADAKRLITNAITIGKNKIPEHKIAYAYVSKDGVELY